jgi:hypothetical protein
MGKTYLGRAVIECGRGGRGYRSEKGEGRRTNRLDADGEPFPPNPHHYIELRDNLRPLERWLKAQAGRPWNKVYSEFCAREDKRTLRGDHVHRHLREMVKGSGGRDYCFWKSPYMEPCYDWHGYRGFFIDRHGLLRHHTPADCKAYAKKLGWKAPERGSLRITKTGALTDEWIKQAYERGKTDVYVLQLILERMNARDLSHPGWWRSPITAAEALCR